MSSRTVPYAELSRWMPWCTPDYDEEIANVVLNGIPGSARPAEPAMPPAQAASLVAYVRTLPQKDGTSRNLAGGGWTLTR